jgi:imidazolonepropionase-like amidohydrolase
MRNRHAVLFLAMAALVAPNAAHAQMKVLRFGAVVDGSGRVIQQGVVILDGDKVVRVGGPEEAASAPRGAQVVDLTRYTAIPGLIDVHTHITYAWDPESKTDPWRQGQRSPELVLRFQRENMSHTLETGVTTIRDLGASNYADVALRDSVNKGVWVGPRMFVSGFGLTKARPPAPPVASTAATAAGGGGSGGGRGAAGGGGGTPVDTTHTQRGRVYNISQIPEAVQQQVAAGADYIKLYGSTGSGADVTGTETFTFDEMRAAVNAAHSFGKRIAIHSYGPVGGRDAVHAGTNTLEHAIDLDDSTLTDMVQRGTFYVPTIDHNRFYAEYAKDFHYTTEQVAALDSFRLRNFETARRAFKAGVMFGMGSDAVFHMFGQNTRELAWYVKLGMTPAQALATATTNGAAILGMDGLLGRIAPGAYADIVAVEGDPLADINVVINNVKWVMKGGAVVVDRTR